MSGGSNGGVVRIEPAATYTKAALAAAFGVTERCIEKRCRGRRPSLPRPFHVGRVPYWRGSAVLQYMDRKQAEAAA